MSYLPTEIIGNKKLRRAHSKEEISFLVRGYTDGEIPDYQMAAWLMATRLNGMTDDETFCLTNEIMNSGTVLDFSKLPFPTVDKHSTGGVGDKTSIILGPLIASLEVGVPMIAGRSLGHTGGTVDKLESIPGFSCDISLEDFKKTIRDFKVAIIGQTSNLCPADKKIYALRDVTATIDSIPLICASIMSKKMAEGAGSLVLDIKFGSGAFMKNVEDGETLANQLAAVGKRFGRKVTCVMTNMNQPLGRFCGNALEVQESMEILKGNGTKFPDTYQLTLDLGAEMLVSCARTNSVEEGRRLCEKALSSGIAYAKFEELCRRQKGDLSRLPMPKEKSVISAEQNGFIQSFDTAAIGNANVILGAGRRKAGEKVNPVAGIEIHKKTGDRVEKGEPLFTMYSHETKMFGEARSRLEKSIKIGTESTQGEPLIWKRIYSDKI